MPFIIAKTRGDVGAFHDSVQGGENFVIFATHAGVAGYQIGGQTFSLSEKIKNTYKSMVIENGNFNALQSAYYSAKQQYWLACGETSGVFDKILVYDIEYKAWTIFASAISGFDITYLKEIMLQGVRGMLIGLSDGHTLAYSPDYINIEYDTNQAGDKVDIECWAATHYFHFNAPSMLKRLVEFFVMGYQDAASNVTFSIIPDGKAEIAIGPGTFYDAGRGTGFNRLRAMVDGRAGLAYMHRIKMQEKGQNNLSIMTLAVRLQIQDFGGNV
jgi:hypothetical protein